MTTATPIVLLTLLTGVTILVFMPLALLLSHLHDVRPSDGRARHLVDIIRLTLTFSLWLGFELVTVTVWAFASDVTRVALLGGCTLLAVVSVHAVYVTPGKTEPDIIEETRSTRARRPS